MLLLNLIASIAIVANFVLAICGYMGVYQLILLIIAALALAVKEVFHLNDPERHLRTEYDFKEGNNWFNSMVDDQFFSVIAFIVIAINIISVLYGLD